MSPYEIIQRAAAWSIGMRSPGSLADPSHRDIRARGLAKPTPERSWSYTQSTGIIRRIIADRMHPLTIGGLEAAMKYLSR